MLSRILFCKVVHELRSRREGGIYLPLFDKVCPIQKYPYGLTFWRAQNVPCTWNTWCLASISFYVLTIVIHIFYQKSVIHKIWHKFYTPNFKMSSRWRGSRGSVPHPPQLGPCFNFPTLRSSSSCPRTDISILQWHQNN